MILVLFWLLVAVGCVAPVRIVIYLFFSSFAFGSFNTIPGSTTFTPYTILAPLLVIKILLNGVRMTLLIDALLNWRKLGLLTAFILVALAVTLTAPILFSGVPTMGLNTGLITPLKFSFGNITQPLYLLTSASMTISVYILMNDRGGRALLAQGVVIGGIITCAAGALDMVFAGTSVLSPLRTANYVLLVDNEIAGMRRVIGFNNEASAYGGTTLWFAATLLFVSPARQFGGLLAQIELPLAVLLIAFTVLSTSSGAYAGLAVLLVLWVCRAVFQPLFANTLTDRRSSAIDIMLICAVLMIATIFVLLHPQVINDAFQAFDTIVLQKKSSDSYIERGNWNRVSLAGMLQTYGFGVGVGSTRASSWPVALLSSTGLLGAAVMVAFILRCLLTPVPPGDPSLRRMAWGARLAWLVCEIPAAGAGTSVDYGFGNAYLFAVMAVIPVILVPQPWLSGGRNRAATQRSGVISQRSRLVLGELPIANGGS